MGVCLGEYSIIGRDVWMRGSERERERDRGRLRYMFVSVRVCVRVSE